MVGHSVRLAAAIAFTVAGVSAASAGGYPNCCAPVISTCGNCGSNPPTIIYGPTGYYTPQPVYRVNQGPVYEPPRLTYGEPAWAPPDDAGPFPYVAPYGGYGLPSFYGRRGFHHHHGVNVYRHYGVLPYRLHRFAGNRPLVRGPMHRGPMHRRH